MSTRGTAIDITLWAQQTTVTRLCIREADCGQRVCLSLCLNRWLHDKQGAQRERDVTVRVLVNLLFLAEYNMNIYRQPL